MSVETARTLRTAHEAPEFGDWSEQPKPTPDLKKRFLVIGLAVLSWVATYVGMLELIEANTGELPLLHKVIIGASVAMLMTMIVWLLDQLFQPNGFVTKLAYLFGYVFLSLISIGFGFGFYWKVLESKGEGTRVAETAVASVAAPLQTAATRLEGLGKTLDSLQAISAQKAEIERTQGTSCPNSRPGDGPRRKLRDDDAARFAFARDMIRTRIETVRADIGGIDGELAKITSNDASIVDKQGTRNDFMKALNRRLDGTVTQFNALRSDPQLRQIRTELDARAGQTQFTDTAGRPFACPDPGLQTMIRAVVASIDALPVLDKPKIATVEGSDATIEAFRRLTATFFGALTFKLPPSAEDLRELQKRAVAQADAAPDRRAAAVAAASGSEQAGLSRRDYIPLSIAIFVDLCLLLVAMQRRRDRLGSLVPKMRQAEQGPVIQILSRFNEIHRDPQVRENFEIFRHVVFDLNGDYYVAVPLDAPARMNPRDREDLRLEAQLLANLFTSFEKEKIFTRVLMPYISTKAIQKKLWKQGSKFAHSESFRLYKFKDGAWSEIILGAIMGAAKRVEAEKRRRRIEDDIFTRHEPRFAGPVSQEAMRRVAPPSMPATEPGASVQPMPPLQRAQGTHGVASAYGVVPPPPRAPMTAAAAAASLQAALATQQPQPEPATVHHNVAAYPGPAARRAEPSAPLTTPLPTEEVVADLAAHRQKLEAQAELAVKAAPVAVVPPATPLSEPLAEAPTITVEAIERTVRFQMPRSDAPLPGMISALLTEPVRADANPAVQIGVAAPAADAASAPVVQSEAESDAEAEFAPFPVATRDADGVESIARRLAPTTQRP
jgi:hypothetical protein